MGDAHVGEGAPQSMHFWFCRVDFWRTKSWAFASSTEISAAIVLLLRQRRRRQRIRDGLRFKEAGNWT
jgi:hypothetical protein